MKNTVVTDVDNLLRKLSREQKRMTQLNNAQLTLVTHDLKKANECAARNSLPDGAVMLSDGRRNICSQEPRNGSR